MKSSYPKSRILPLFIFIVACIYNINVSARTVNVIDYGADPSGTRNSSSIINQLIDKLSGEDGGTIYLPAGRYLCGPIFLKSNITLYAENGCSIVFSDDFDLYLPFVQTQWEGVRLKTFASPIYAINANNIAIKGEGHFEGNGEKWWNEWLSISRNKTVGNKYQKMFITENQALLDTNSYIQNMHNFLRPPMVMFYNCENISIEGVSFSNPPFWTIVPTYCNNVTISNISIDNPGHSPNTDGIDICSCTNVHISNSHISVGDDCIVIKSGRDEDGRSAAKPTENVTISNCTMLNGHGGVVIGSEMSGNVKRIAISNCVFEGTDRGIRLKSMRGRGGVVEDIRVSNIVMKDIVQQGIMINMRYHQTQVEDISERTPEFHRIHFSNINIINAANGISIFGLEERSVAEVSFADIYLEANNGVYAQYAQRLNFDNIRLKTKSTKPFIFENCSQLMLSKIQVLENIEAGNQFDLTDTHDVMISNCFQIEPIGSFVSLSGECPNIYLMNNVISRAKKIVSGDNNQSVVQYNNVLNQ